MEKKIYWDFDDIIKTIERKLKTLAIVKFVSKKTNNNEQSIELEEETNYIADNNILSNPFFTTLAPID